MAETWKKCTECRTEIAFGAMYYQCSVSTCNRARMPLVFCSVVCWDCHLSSVRHRDAGAIEARAPSQEAWRREQASEPVAEKSAPTVDPRPRPATSPGVISRPGTPVPTPSTSSGVPRMPTPTSDSVQPRVRADETRPNLIPPPPAGPDAVRRVVVSAPAPSEGPDLADVVDKDVLIVISKMKKYIKDRSGMNCSDAVADMLSEHVRAICDDSIRAAARDERKTVLDRDVPRARR